MIIIIRSPPDLRRRVPYLGRRTSPVPFDGPDRTPPSPKPRLERASMPDRSPRRLGQLALAAFAEIPIGGHADALQDGSRCSRPPGRCRCQGPAASTSAKSWLKRRRMVRSSTCGVGHRSSTPFATLNHFPGELGAPRESATRRVGIKGRAALAAIIRYKLSIRLSCHHASNRHCSRCPNIRATSWCRCPLTAKTGVRVP